MAKALHAILQHPRFPQGKFWHEETFEPEAIILQEGDVSQDLYLIVSGVVRVNLEVDIDETHHFQSGLSELTSGETFGELNLYGTYERSATAVALSEARLIRIDGRALSDFMDANPELGYGVLKDFFLEHATELRSANLRVSGLYAEKLKKE
jgi:CRP-like cAMP-binding protein